MAEELVRRCRPLLGTFVEIATPVGSEAAVDAAFAIVAHVHARMSFHEETSDLAALRGAPVGQIVSVDVETIAVLRQARALYRRSGGLFDVSIGADLVRFGFLPRPDLSTAATGTADDIEIVDDTHVRCHRALLIDLGGIAKGHAVDRAIEVLAERGVTEAIVNAGGDLRVLGAPAEPIHLRDADGRICHAIQLADAAVATSSNLHDRRADGGRIATPHLDAGRNPILSDHAVTIVADRCIVADAMTKVALANPTLAEAMLAEMGGEILALREAA